MPPASHPASGSTGRRSTDGHAHDAAFYGDEAEFGALIMPFVEQGVAAGESVILGYEEPRADLVRSWLDDPSAVTFLTGSALYSTPARAIAAYRRLFGEEVEAGARRIRIAGDVPHAGNGGRFDGWDRYEAAVNHVWDDFPVRSLCLYDAATVPDDVRDVVERTHPHMVTPSGDRYVNTRYQDIESFEGLPAPTDPLETSLPHVELIGALSAEARHAVEEIARQSVDGETLGELMLGVSEAVTNAHLHGAPPTILRAWAAPDRVVVHVRDSGDGPADPLVGLVPVPNSSVGGLGLWMAHQLDTIDITLIPAPDGFTVRLRAERS